MVALSVRTDNLLRSSRGSSYGSRQAPRIGTFLG